MPTVDPDEIAASVAKVLPQTISYPFNALGTRDLGATYTDYQSAAISCFLSSNEAPYYVVKLARDRLLTAISDLQVTISNLIVACQNTTRRVQPVSNVNTLTNAQVALQNMSAALSARTGVYQDITTVPSFKNFTNNVNSFLKTEGSKVTAQGALVDVPATAQASLRSSVVALRASWDALIQKLMLWSGSMTAYTALNLPTTFSQTVIDNAAQVLQQNVAVMEGQTPVDRLASLRGAVVDAVAVQAAVQGFGSLQPPTLFALLTGVGRVFADATHPASFASLPSDFTEGYSVYAGRDTINLLLDGQYALTLNPPGSFLAQHTNVSAGPFNTNPTSSPGINSFSVSVLYNDGPVTRTVTTEVITLPLGTVQPWDVVSAVNAQAVHVRAGLTFLVQKTSDEVTLAAGGLFVLENGLTWTSLGVVVGDWLLVNDSTSLAYNRVFEITMLADSTATAVPADGGGAAAPEAAKRVTVGISSNLRFYLQLVDVATALAKCSSLQVLDVVTGTLVAIGLYPGAAATTTRTSAAVFAQLVNQSTASATLDGVPRLAATTEFQPTFFSGTGRTSTTDAFLLSLYTYTEKDVGFVRVGGATVFTSEALAAHAQPGAMLVIRGTTSALDTNAYGVVTSVAGSTVTAALTLSGVSGVADVDLGPNYYSQSDLRKELTVVISEGQLFDGDYPVSITPGPTPLDVRVTKPITGNIGQAGQPVQIRTLQIGETRVVLTNQDMSLRGSLEVTGGTFAFTSMVPRAVYAQTLWVSLPSIPSQVQAGDVFELYTTDTRAPSFTSEVLSVDSASGILGLVAPLPVNTPPFTLSPEGVLPFGRVRRTVHQNFNQSAQTLEQWLAVPYIKNTTLFFQNLDAALNPVLMNKHPTSTQANVPIQLFQTMLNALQVLSACLSGYSAEVDSSVDALIKGFLQKGLDRAVDTLLAADFKTFFSLGQGDGSYTGALSRAMKDVQVTDFPVRRDNRVHAADAATEQTLASTNEGPDFDYTAEALDPQKRIENTEPISPAISLPIS